LPQGEAAYRKLNQLHRYTCSPGRVLTLLVFAPSRARGVVGGDSNGGATRRSPRTSCCTEQANRQQRPVHPAIPETRYLKAFFVA
jgi:hypothetical protein